MLSDEEKEKILELDDQGWTAYAIGKEINKDPKTVINFLKDGGEEVETPTPRISKRHKPRGGRPLVQEAPDIHPRVAEAKANAEVLGWKIEEEKNRQKLEETTGPKQHPALATKKAKVEIVKLDLDEYKAKMELGALKKEELRKARAEREAHLQRIEEAERAREEEERIAEEREKRKKHQEWIEDRKNYAVNWCLPLGVNIPPGMRFQIKDKVGEVLTNRSEDEYGIDDLIRETVKTVLQPYLNEQEAKRKAEEAKRREEEAKRKRAKKIELINRALGEVDNYIKRNRLEPYVNEEAKKKIKEQVYTHLLETLPEDIWHVSDSQVREILDSVLKDAKEKAMESERKEFREKLKEMKIKDLLQAGMNRFNYYFLINSKELGTVSPQEREQAKRYLERELKREVEGDETVQEIEKITNQILDDFFFES